MIKFYSARGCTLSHIYIKTLFSIENGIETTTQITASELRQNIVPFVGSCHLIVSLNKRHENNVNDAAVIYKNHTKDCYFCYEFIVRSPNVIQYRRSDCQIAPLSGNISSLCSLISTIELETGFVQNREDASDFNCKSIIEGVYAFDYRIVGSTGVCSSPNSIIKACQRQGSPLRDNSVFTQTYGYCPDFQDISATEDPNIVYGKANIWRCYGRWVDKDGSIWAAIEYDTNQPKLKFRCMTTRIDQQNPDDSIHWAYFPR
ncbi:unnamed protein product [Protopolystoma xenopodis]|uniref:Uncharacterized protein n=1 Tax=Protopolystoma xenopodis TaxID=117903 RepID=A0A448WW19_9PLAT|nr:unnamed protein product [Protopolystoma xenopodis]